MLYFCLDYNKSYSVAMYFFVFLTVILVFFAVLWRCTSPLPRTAAPKWLCFSYFCLEYNKTYSVVTSGSASVLGGLSIGVVSLNLTAIPPSALHRNAYTRGPGHKRKGAGMVCSAPRIFVPIFAPGLGSFRPAGHVRPVRRCTMKASLGQRTAACLLQPSANKHKPQREGGEGGRGCDVSLEWGVS